MTTPLREPPSPKALAALVAGLSSPDRDVRWRAGMNLSAATGPLPAGLVPAVLAYAHAQPDGDHAHALQHALRTLTRAPVTPDVLAEFGRRARSEVGAVRRYAWQMIGLVGPAAAPLLPELVARFEAAPDRDLGVALGKVGGIGVEALMRAFRSGDRDRIGAAYQGLEAAGPAALPLLPDLLAALRTPGAPGRWAAGGIVVALGPAAAGAWPAVLGLAADEEYGCQEAAESLLRRLGPAGVEYLDVFVCILRAPDRAWSRGRAARALARFAPQTTAVIDPLREALRGCDPAAGGRHEPGDDGVAMIALGGLKASGPAAAAAAPEVARFVRSPHHETRTLVLQTLAVLGDTSRPVLDAVIRATRDEIPVVRKAALDALADLRPNTPAVLEAVAAAEADALKGVQARARRARRRIERAAKLRDQL